MSHIARSPAIDDELARSCVLPKVASSAVSAWATETDARWGGVGASLSSIFDLGSVTKPCIAVLAGVAQRMDLLRLDEPIGDILSFTQHSSIAKLPLRTFLRHESSLRAHYRFYADSWGGSAIRIADVLRRASLMTSGAEGETVYSDLGYMLVGRALEVRLGAPLDHLLARHVCGPWGLELGSARAFLRRSQPQFIETEVQPPRGGTLRAQVHDDNAWALGGFGLCGHAGLFGTLGGMVSLCRILLQASRGTGPAAEVLPELLDAPSTQGFSAGFMRPTGALSSAGANASASAFGHLGFPGVSFWCDPEGSAATVLLTNRVFPRRSRSRGTKTIQELRREHHDFLWEAHKSFANCPPPGAA